MGYIVQQDGWARLGKLAEGLGSLDERAGGGGRLCQKKGGTTPHNSPVRRKPIGGWQGWAKMGFQNKKGPPIMAPISQKQWKVKANAAEWGGEGREWEICPGARSLRRVGPSPD